MVSDVQHAALTGALALATAALSGDPAAVAQLALDMGPLELGMATGALIGLLLHTWREMEAVDGEPVEHRLQRIGLQVAHL